MQSRFRHIGHLWLIGLCVPACVAQAVEGDLQGAWHMTAKPVQIFTATLVLQRKSATERVTEYVAYAMVPPRLAQQPNVTAEMLINGRAGFATIINDRSALARPAFLGRARPFTRQEEAVGSVAVNYRGTMYRRYLTRGTTTNPVPALSASDRFTYLRRTKSIDFDQPAFQQWMAQHDLVRKPGESVLQLACRAYLSLKQNIKYEGNPQMPGINVSRFCGEGRGNCAHYSMLFVAVMRANHVPAMVWRGSGSATKQRPARR